MGKSGKEHEATRQVEFRDVVAAFDARLKPMGFQRKKHLWSRKRGEIWQCLELGRSNFSRHFYFRLGVYIEMLDRELPREGGPAFPRYASGCHLSGNGAPMMDVDDRQAYHDLRTFENTDQQALELKIDEHFLYMRKFRILEQLEEISTYEGIAAFITSGKPSMSTFLVKHYYSSVVVKFCLARAASLN